MKTTQTTQEERDQLRKIFDQWAEEAPSDANLDREGFVISCLPALLDDANEAERLEADNADLRRKINDEVRRALDGQRRAEGLNESCERYIRDAHAWRDRAVAAEERCEELELELEGWRIAHQENGDE